MPKFERDNAQFAGAFHWRDGIFVQRTPTGIAIVLPDEALPNRVIDIPWTEWQSIVSYATQGPKRESE